MKSKNRAAQSLGRLGGSAGTEAQNEARRVNGRLGGRPRVKPTRDEFTALLNERWVVGAVARDRGLAVTCENATVAAAVAALAEERGLEAEAPEAVGLGSAVRVRLFSFPRRR